MSKHSAARCREFLLSIDQRDIGECFFGCNTLVRDEFEPEKIRLFLKRWRTKFEREFPEIGCIVVKELTDAGTVHLHFIVIWPKGKSHPTLKEFRGWNDVAWNESVRSTAVTWAGGKWACTVNVVKSWEGACCYLAGYLSVKDDREVEIGKRWNVINRQFVPIHRVPVPRLSRRQGQFVQRSLRRHRQSQVFWLHSGQTHDTLRSQGVPVKWKRIRKVPVTFCGLEMRSFSQYLATLRYFGLRVKRAKPACFRREERKAWSEDEETGKVMNFSGADGSQVEKFSACTSRFHVSSESFFKLVELARQVCPEPIEYS